MITQISIVRTDAKPQELLEMEPYEDFLVEDRAIAVDLSTEELRLGMAIKAENSANVWLLAREPRQDVSFE